MLAAGLVLLAAYIAWLGGDRPLRFLTHPLLSDFALYYRDARVGLVYGWSHMYDLGPYLQVTRALHISNGDPRVPSLSFPLLTWLVAPVALLPLPLAYAVWLVLAIACLVAAWALLAPGRGRSRWWQLAVAAAFPPAAFAVGLGQSVLLVLFAVAAAARLLRDDRQALAGLVLTLTAVKPHVALLVPVALLVSGRRTAIATWAAGTAAIVAVVLGIVPEPALAEYARRILAASRAPQAWGVLPDLTFTRLPVPLDLLTEGVCAAAALGVARLRKSDSGVVVAAALLGSLLAAPYLHYDDLVLLLAAGWLLMGSALEAGLKPILWAGFAAVVAGPLAGFGPLHAAEVGCLALLALPALPAWRRVRRAPAAPLGRVAERP